MVYKSTLGDGFYTLCDLSCSSFFEKLLEAALAKSSSSPETKANEKT